MKKLLLLCLLTSILGFTASKLSAAKYFCNSGSAANALHEALRDKNQSKINQLLDNSCSMNRFDRQVCPYINNGSKCTIDEKDPKHDCYYCNYPVEK